MSRARQRSFLDNDLICTGVIHGAARRSHLGVTRACRRVLFAPLQRSRSTGSCCANRPAPTEHAGLVDFCRPLADTIITCLDARTGAVLWRVTFSQLSGNYQTHKWRGLNPTACVLGPVVIAADLSSNWVGLKAATGEILWKITAKPKVEGDRAVIGAIAAGKLAILPTNSNEPARAIDPTTGKTIWQQPGGPQAFAWGEPGAERVVFLGRGFPTCHDAATGKLLWTMDEKLVGVSGSAALIENNILVGHVIPDPKKLRGGHFQGWKLADSGPTKLWQDDFLPFDENLTVSLGAGKAYLVGQNEIRCLDLNTGKRLRQQTFDDKASPVGSNQWLGIIGGRLLLAPEGQHGSLVLQMLSADDLKPVGPRRAMPNNSTTAYGVHSLGFPVADGRMFVRGMDGIYCYDLRSAKR